VFHGAGKFIFVNPHVKRLELMKEVDGFTRSSLTTDST